MNKLQKARPIGRVNELSEDWNQYFDSFFNPFMPRYNRYITQWTQTDDGYVSEFELPGIHKSELEIEKTGKTIHVKANGKNRQYFYQVHLPADAMTDDIDAKLEDGILYLSVKSGKTTGTKIEVK